MHFVLKQLGVALLVIFTIGCQGSKSETQGSSNNSSSKSNEATKAEATAPAPKPGPSQASRIENEAPFAYYVLALSWSPEYCADQGRNDRFQCVGKRFAFVVHGLWPQNERRPYPADCAVGERVPNRLSDEMLSIMPSPRLIRHEWEKHGTCSGLRVDEYFQRVKEAYAAVTIPAIYRQPDRPVNTTVRDLEAAFLAENPGLTPDAIAVTCKRANDLQEIRICMTKDLKFRACSPDVNDTCRATVRMKPVR